MESSTISFATTRPLFDDHNSTTTTTSDATTTVELPFGIEILAPILMFVLATVVTCNLVLMALVIKARKVNNKTNIYLFSLSTSSLLESVSLFSLMITVFARRWIFGREFCYINDFIFRLSVFPILPIHALVSRDRYKAVKNPVDYWRVSTKKTYILNIIVWTVSSILSLASLMWHAVRTPLPNTQLLGIECYCALHLIKAELTVSLIEIFPISFFKWLWLISLSIYTVWHYVLVMRELHKLAKHCSQARILSNSTILKINPQDKPLHCTAEERAAKSLALMFLFEFVCSLTSLVILSILTLMSFISNQKFNGNNNSVASAIVALLFIYTLPGINPLILAVSNKRFRKRIRGLLKCELTPEFEETNDHYRHLDETDTLQLPSTGASGAQCTTTTRRRSLFINTSIIMGSQVRPGLSDAQEADEDTTAMALSAKRNASIATVGAVDVKIKEFTESHDRAADDNALKVPNILDGWEREYVHD